MINNLFIYFDQNEKGKNQTIIQKLTVEQIMKVMDMATKQLMKRAYEND